MYEMEVLNKLKRATRPARVSIRNKTRDLSWRIKRSLWPPILPKNIDGKVLIHLGCGPQNDPRYINVDGAPLPHVHYVSRVEKLPMFTNNFADLLYACHVLEHISHLQTVKVLNEWLRILKPKGVLRLSVPDFDKIISMYEAEGKSIPRTLPPLMGTQDGGEFDFHKTAFNIAYLSDLLKSAGFREVRSWDPMKAEYYNFKDWAGPRLIHGIYPISLNLEGIK